MAGIGFELRKVVGAGGVGSFVRAAFSGVMIVAGPWIVSIVGIAVIQSLSGPTDAGARTLFLAVVVYTYAWSLILFGGFHFLYTRVIADLLYEKKPGEAAGSLVLAIAATAAASTAVAVAAQFAIGAPPEYPLLFRAGAVCLFVSVNLIWILMIFASLLRWFARILGIYVIGMTAAVLLVLLLERRFGISGAMAGFACGHAVIAALLAALSFREHRPVGVPAAVARIRKNSRVHAALFAIGVLYYCGIWADKVIFWFLLGEPVDGTSFRLYEAYDMIVFAANLSMIPGLVYFVIASETNFYVLLRKFLLTLTSGTLAVIRRRKQLLIDGMRRGIRAQSIFQGVFTAALVAAAPLLASVVADGGVDTTILRITLLGVFFHLLFLTTINLHFYFQFFGHAAATCAVYLAVNGALAAATGMATGAIALSPGASYVAAGAAASLYGQIALQASARRFDRIILAEAGGV